MQYVDYGNTGAKVSRLGMGCMRLPCVEKEGAWVFDEEKSIILMHRAIELGINFFDIAPYYCNNLAEGFLGKALKGVARDKVYIANKSPIDNSSGAAYEKHLESSLKNMDLEYFDFYLFWGVSLNTFLYSIQANDGPLERAVKLKEQGLIKHISFSFHDSEAGLKEGENLIEVLKRGEGVLETLLCQYNLLDRGKESGLALAHEMGMGTSVMGPVGGGRLGAPSKVIMDMLPGKCASSAELALRFVLANPNVNIALSGFTFVEHLEENVQIADNINSLSVDEIKQLKTVMKEKERLAGLYCTGCRYCQPCPENINIPEIFTIMNYHRIYELTDYAKKNYADIGNVPWMNYKNASACMGCGLCENKCPQDISIIKQLKETHATLSAQ